MSRFDFDDDGNDHQITWEMMQWNLDRHLKSAKGQAKLREFRAALLAVPDRRLIDGDLAWQSDVCAIGAYAAYKRMQQGLDWPTAVQAIRDQYQPDMPPWGPPVIDAYETQDIGIRECGLNRTLAWMLAYRNDETLSERTPEQRWQDMYDWACKKLAVQ